MKQPAPFWQAPEHFGIRLHATATAAVEHHRVTGRGTKFGKLSRRCSNGHQQRAVCGGAASTVRVGNAVPLVGQQADNQRQQRGDSPESAE